MFILSGDIWILKGLIIEILEKEMEDNKIVEVEMIMDIFCFCDMWVIFIMVEEVDLSFLILMF